MYSFYFNGSNIDMILKYEKNTCPSNTIDVWIYKALFID